MATIYKRVLPSGTITRTLQWVECGKRYTKALGVTTQAKAEIALHEKELDLRGVTTTSKRNSLIFKNFAIDYLDWYVKKYPTSYYRIEQLFNQYLIPEFGLYALDEISKSMVQKYEDKRREPIEFPNGKYRSPKTDTINKEIRQLKAALNYAVDHDKIKSNPIARFKYTKSLDSKPMHFFRANELAKIYELSNRAHWWQFLANTGMRLGEALNLKWTDINYDDDYINIISTDENRTKSAKYRQVPIFDGVKLALDKFEKDGVYVYPRMHDKSYSRAAKVDITRAGFIGSAHSFRHTYCTHLLNQGATLAEVQELAGHSTITVTEKYLHINVEDIKKKLNLSL